MRIGTWNVEYAAGAAKNELRLRRLYAMNADIWGTETHDDLDLGSDYFSASTTRRATGRAGARWTTIWSRFPIANLVQVADPHRTVAALIESVAGPLLVFGTVLPWGTDRGPAGIARGWDEHHRVIPLQGSEWMALREAHPTVPICVAGDLNMNLGGPHYYGTSKGRTLLRAALADAELVCVTDTDHVPEGWLSYAPIDHVCLSAPWAARAKVVEAWEGTDTDGVRLSDHSGLVVEIAE